MQHTSDVPSTDRPASVYFESPRRFRPGPADPPSVFPAGGIPGVEDWRARAIDRLLASGQPLVVLNPQRANFPHEDPLAGDQQLDWEQVHLGLADVTLFWIPACDPTVTFQPTTLLELGYALAAARTIVVGVDPAYPAARQLRAFTRYHRPDEPVYSTLEDVVDATIDELSAVR